MERDTIVKCRETSCRFVRLSPHIISGVSLAGRPVLTLDRFEWGRVVLAPPTECLANEGSCGRSRPAEAEKIDERRVERSDASRLATPVPSLHRARPHAHRQS